MIYRISVFSITTLLYILFFAKALPAEALSLQNSLNLSNDSSAYSASDSFLSAIDNKTIALVTWLRYSFQAESLTRQWAK